MTQPGLDLGDVGFVFQGIGGCGCSESMDAQAVDLNSGLIRVDGPVSMIGESRQQAKAALELASEADEVIKDIQQGANTVVAAVEQLSGQAGY